MGWSIEFGANARKQLRSVAPADRRRIIAFLEERVALHPEPRLLAKRIVNTDREIWRFRVGDYRILCEILEGRLTILVVALGHRREIYR